MKFGLQLNSLQRFQVSLKSSPANHPFVHVIVKLKFLNQIQNKTLFIKSEFNKSSWHNQEQTTVKTKINNMAKIIVTRANIGN